MPPQVSVLMPVYNAERYVAEAVESILNQTFTDYEFIIIDDGSTDGSLAILQKYAAQDSRIRLVSRPNTGIVGALNEGLAMARGEYIARMDADDISLPERFHKQVDHLNQTSDCVAVGCRVLLIDPEGLPLTAMPLVTTHVGIDGAHLAGKGGSISHPASVICKKALMSIGGYKEEFYPAEDYDLFLRLAELGKLANLPEILLKYRQHHQSIGYSRREQQRKAAHSALMAAYERRNLDMPSLPTLSETNPVSRFKVFRRWAWWALQGGNVKTARKYALYSFLRSPMAIQSWKLLACSIRGH